MLIQLYNKYKKYKRYKRYKKYYLKKEGDNDFLEEYDHFSENSINELNYDKLWIELKKIEKKAYGECTFLTYEENSELCYEEGKFIENLEWTGEDIRDNPEELWSGCSYNNMNYNQLKYYLFWRTHFRNGKFVEIGYKGYYYMYVRELLAELGPFSSLQILNQLEQLYKACKEKFPCSYWIKEYADNHGLKIEDDDVQKELYNVTWYSEEEKRELSMYEITQGDYSDVFEFMSRKSRWKCKNSSFIKQAQCIEDIEEVVIDMMPKLERLFSDAGIAFTDFLVGKMKKLTRSRPPYDGSKWAEGVRKRMGLERRDVVCFQKLYPSDNVYITDEDGNIERKTRLFINYRDDYLSEYILKYTEMLFRKEVGYKHISIPVKLSGALKVKFTKGYGYLLSSEEELQHEQIIYISLFDEIEHIIIESVEEYMNVHQQKMNEIKKRFLKIDQSRKKLASKNVMSSPKVRREYDLIEREQNIDDESIRKAREVLRKNQDRLVIDDAIDNEEEKLTLNNVEQFTSEEKQLLQVLLEGENVREKMIEFEKKFISVNLLIEGINNKVMDKIGDLIIEWDEEPSIVKDYLAEARNLLKK